MFGGSSRPQARLATRPTTHQGSSLVSVSPSASFRFSLVDDARARTHALSLVDGALVETITEEPGARESETDAGPQGVEQTRRSTSHRSEWGRPERAYVALLHRARALLHEGADALDEPRALAPWPTDPRALRTELAALAAPSLVAHEAWVGEALEQLLRSARVKTDRDVYQLAAPFLLVQWPTVFRLSDHFSRPRTRPFAERALGRVIHDELEARRSHEVREALRVAAVAGFPSTVAASLAHLHHIPSPDAWLDVLVDAPLTSAHGGALRALHAVAPSREVRGLLRDALDELGPARRRRGR